MKKPFMELVNKIKSIYKNHRLPSLIGCGALVLVIILTVIFSTPKNEDENLTTEMATLTSGDVTQSIEIVGSVRAVPSTTLTWNTSGVVMPFTVKIGDEFKAGDVILELDASTVPASVLQAQTDLIDAQNNLALLESADTEYQTAAQTLADAEYSYNEAKKYFVAIIEEEGVTIDTVEPLIEAFYDARETLWAAQDAATATETLAATDQKRIDALAALDKAQHDYNQSIDTIMNVAGFYFGTDFGSSHQSTYMTYRSAKAALNEARADWNTARNDSDAISAAAAKVQALTNTVTSMKIIAPFDGTVTDIFNYEGDHVSSGTSAIQLDNLKVMVVDVSVSEVDVNHIAVGDNVAVTFDAINNKVYDGVVSQVGESGIDNSGVIKFNVSITLTDLDELIKPGFTAVSTITTDHAEGVLLVPVSAIHTLNGQKVVVIRRNGLLTTLPITLGATSEMYSELIDGDLQEGDQVAISLSPASAESLGFE
jgi:HlyD family secretion protein